MEQNYLTTGKECFINFIRDFTLSISLIWTKLFILFNDREPLRWTKSIKHSSQRLIRWRIKLWDSDYNFVHESGNLTRSRWRIPPASHTWMFHQIVRITKNAVDLVTRKNCHIVGNLYITFKIINITYKTKIR